MFREDEPHPILGETVALGGPFFITGLNRIVNPELKDGWPFNVINNFAIKMIPIAVSALIMFGSFYLVYKGMTIMLKKIKKIFKETEKEITRALVYHHEEFERALKVYIKEDKKARNEEMEKFKNEVIAILNEKLGQPALIPINSAKKTVIKNFV